MEIKELFITIMLCIVTLLCILWFIKMIFTEITTWLDLLNAVRKLVSQLLNKKDELFQIFRQKYTKKLITEDDQPRKNFFSLPPIIGNYRYIFIGIILIFLTLILSGYGYIIIAIPMVSLIIMVMPLFASLDDVVFQYDAIAFILYRLAVFANIALFIIGFLRRSSKYGIISMWVAIILGIMLGSPYMGYM